MTERDPLHPLFAAMLDRELTDTERADLHALLADDPEAMRRYLDLITTHALLGWEQAEQIPTVTPAPQPARPASTEPAHRGILRSLGGAGPIAWPLAASLALTAAVVAIYVFSVSRPPSPVPSDSVPIATLIDATDTVVINDDLGNPGSDYSAGTYSIRSGSAELQLTSGTNVRLSGRTRLTLLGDMRASLEFGFAAFHCPPRAKGFAVSLADGSRIVDLGTGFNIRAEDDGMVWVREGRIRLEPLNGQAFELIAGQAAFRNPDGAWVVDGPLAAGLPTDQLVLWLRADDALITDDRDRFDRWINRAGPGVVTAEASGRVPVRSPEPIGNRPALRTGADAPVLMTDPIALGDSQTIAIVFRDTAGDAIQRQLINLNGPPHLVVETAGQPRRVHVRAYDGQVTAGQIVGPPLSAQSPTVAVVRADPESGRLQLWINGRNAGDAAVPFPLAQTSAKAIARHPFGAAPFVGDIADVLVYDAALSDTQIQQLHSALAERYDIKIENPAQTKETPR